MPLEIDSIYSLITSSGYFYRGAIAFRGMACVPRHEPHAVQPVRHERRLAVDVSSGNRAPVRRLCIYSVVRLSEEFTMGAQVEQTIGAPYTPAIECVIEQIPRAEVHDPEPRPAGRKYQDYLGSAYSKLCMTDSTRHCHDCVRTPFPSCQ